MKDQATLNDRPRLKCLDLPALQLRPDLLKLLYGLHRVKPLPTVEADLGLYLEDRCVVAPTQELLDLLFDQFPTTDQTATERDHFSISRSAS